MVICLKDVELSDHKVLQSRGIVNSKNAGILILNIVSKGEIPASIRELSTALRYFFPYKIQFITPLTMGKHFILESGAACARYVIQITNYSIRYEYSSHHFRPRSIINTRLNR